MDHGRTTQDSQTSSTSQALQQNITLNVMVIMPFFRNLVLVLSATVTLGRCGSNFEAGVNGKRSLLTLILSTL